MSFGQKKFPLNSGLLLLIALVGTLATTIISFSLIVLGRGGPSLAAYGIGSMSLFAFLLTIQVLHGKSESKDDFLKKGSCPNCNRHIVHRGLPHASGSGSRPWSGAQSQQRHSRKLPSGLHFHNRNLLHHSKPGTDSRPSKGKIVNLRLTTPASLSASGFSVPHSPGRVITPQSRQPRPIL